jgi:hypothetical protein
VSPEVVAALSGAVVGAGVALVGQLGLSLVGARRARKVAARVIYAELTVALGEASTAISFGEWPSPTGLARRSAFETYGVNLAGGRGIMRIAFVAEAYSALDDLGWLSRKKALAADDESQDLIRIVRAGLYEAGRISGLSDRELKTRGVLTDDVNEHIASRRDQYRRASAKPEGFKADRGSND